MTDSTVVAATGSDTEVCLAAIRATSPNPYSASVTVIAKESFDGMAWLICQPEPEYGASIASAHAQDPGHWLVTAVCASPPYHAGDVVDAKIVSGQSAWVTEDTLYPGDHTYDWTRDGGKTWMCLNH